MKIKKYINNNKKVANKIHISEPRSNINNNEFKMKYNERISRLLLVIGTFSLLGLLFQKLWGILPSIFNILYINSKIPIGAEHIWISIFLSDISLIFIASLFYCLCELYNFTTYSQKNYTIKYQTNADKYFKKLLAILIICITLTISTMLITMVIFLISNIWKKFLMLSAFLIISSIIIIFDRKNFLINLQAFVTNFKLNIFSICFYSISWLLLGLLFFLFGSFQIGYSEKSISKFKFENENKLILNIQFENIIPEEIIIQSDMPNTSPIILNKSNFFNTYVEVTKENLENPSDLTPATNQFIYKHSFYEYHSKVDLTNLIQDGKNTIFITFSIDGNPLTKKSYKILNQINKVNNKYEIYRKDFDISLE